MELNMAVDKIVCVGKNYLDHAVELGDAIPETPVLFLKPASVLRQAQHWQEHLNLIVPNDSCVQPECEIVLQVAHDGYKISSEAAKNSISAVTLGLDMTLRTHQAELKKKGHPWTTAKVFPDAAVLGPWIPYTSFRNYLDTEFQLKIDGHITQQAKGSAMRMSPQELLVYISQFFPLKAGDIIFTGTPAGVSSVSSKTTATLCWQEKSFTVNWI